MGGSYYVVKNLLQETMYKSKLSPLETMNRSILRKEVAIENVMVTEAETVSSSDVKGTVNVKGRQESETSTEVDRGFVKPIRPVSSGQSSYLLIASYHMLFTRR